MAKLFADDDDQDDDLRVNARFAKALDEKEGKRLRMKEEALLGDEDSEESSDEDEDEDGEELTPELDLQIVKTINAIRRKDSSIYDGATKFFQEMEPPKAPKEKQEKQTFKDVARAQILAAVEDDEEDEEHNYAYDEEQRTLREGFKLELEDDDDDEIFVAPEKKNKVVRDDDDDDKVEAELQKELETFETLGSEKRDDAFLADYVAKKKWKVPQAIEDVSEDEDDDEEDKAEAFEASYNFRFEQEGGGAVTTHARNSGSSLRRTETSRKAKRKKKKDTLEVLKKQKLDQLRAQRKQDLARQQAVLLDAAGVANAPDLDADFDPEDHDRHMADVFNDAYYDAPDPKKPAKIDDEALAVVVEDPGNTAFKYTAVQPDAYGLSALDILEHDDSDLKQLVSVKKLAPYRETPYVLPGKKHKKWRQALNKKKSLAQQEPEQPQVKQPKKKKKKTVEQPVEEQPKKQKKKKDVSKARLASYGL